jgi:RecB family exonuclease
MTKLSHTAVNMYENCELCYFLHYIKGVRPKKVKSYFLFGSVVDKALNKLLLTGSVQEANQELFKEWAKANEENDIEFSKSDMEPQMDGWHSLYYKGTILIEAYRKQVFPKIKKVLAVQEPVSLKNSEGDEITGFLDIIVEWEDGKVYLLDHKTSSAKYAEDSAQKSPQLALYHYIAKDKYKIDGVGYIVLPKKLRKKAPYVDIQIILGTLEEGLEDKTVENFDRINTLVSNGVFDKKHNPNGKYGPCPYSTYYTGSPDFYIKEDK